MTIAKDRMFALGSLTATSTQEPWRYSKGRVTDKGGQVIAYICDPSADPDFQQETNGELIAEIRNNAAQILTIISNQQWTIERLQARVLRLESELYQD